MGEWAHRRFGRAYARTSICVGLFIIIICFGRSAAAAFDSPSLSSVILLFNIYAARRAARKTHQSAVQTNELKSLQITQPERRGTREIEPSGTGKANRRRKV